SPVSATSASSCASSTAYGAREACVCSASHGQPPGERSRSITATACSRACPAAAPGVVGCSGSASSVTGSAGRLVVVRGVDQPVRAGLGDEQPSGGGGVPLAVAGVDGHVQVSELLGDLRLDALCVRLAAGVHLGDHQHPG